MFHHRPLQHCLFTMVCVLLSLPPAFWTAWRFHQPTRTPTGRLVPQRFSTRFGETSCHVHRGVVWKLEFAISCAAPPRGALGLSVLGVWGEGYPLGGGAKKTWCLIQIDHGDRWCWKGWKSDLGGSIFSWAFKEIRLNMFQQFRLVKYSSLFYGGVDSKYQNPPHFFKTTVISLEKWRDLRVNPTLQYKNPPCLYGSMATGRV